jgi:hypothetical protein
MSQVYPEFVASVGLLDATHHLDCIYGIGIQPALPTLPLLI